MREERRRTVEPLVVLSIGRIDQLVDGWRRCAVSAENLEQCRQIFLAYRFVERDGYRALVDVAQVDPPRGGAIDDVVSAGADHFHPDCVEEILVYDAVPQALQALGEDCGVLVYPLRDATQPLGSVPDCVHAR